LAGMSAIARVLVGRGFRVSGSDRQPNALTELLAAEGVTLFAGHAPENVKGAGIVVVSSAVPGNNPEWKAAVAKGIPVLKRAELIGALMEGTVGIAVAGS